MNTMSINTAGLAGIAEALVAARRAARPLAGFPGAVPPDLATAYAVQDAAIAHHGVPVAGWKVAIIAPQFRERYPSARLAGPVLAGTVSLAEDGHTIEVPVVPGGFAAVEAEFVVRIGRDLPPRAETYTDAEIAAAIGAVHAGVEIAGFPLAGINGFGPGVVIACFGNNAGLIVGKPIAEWMIRPASTFATEVTIDGVEAGRGSAAVIPRRPGRRDGIPRQSSVRAGHRPQGRRLGVHRCHHRGARGAGRPARPGRVRRHRLHRPAPGRASLSGRRWGRLPRSRLPAARAREGAAGARDGIRKDDDVVSPIAPRNVMV